MALPQIPNIPRSREYMQDFKGYNHNLRIAENEFYDELNLSADNYPVLSTRKARASKYFGAATMLGAVGQGENIYYAINDTKGVILSKNGERLLARLNTDTSDVGERQLLFFGAWLLVFPDCYSYNTADGTGKYIDYLVSTENDDCEIVLQEAVSVANGVSYVDYTGFIATESEMSRNPYKYEGSTVACVEDNTGRLLWVGRAWWQEDGDEWWCDNELDRLRLQITFPRKITIEKLEIDFSNLGMLSRSTLATTFEAHISDDELIWGDAGNGKTFVCLDGYAMPYKKIKIKDKNLYYAQIDETSGEEKLVKMDSMKILTVQEKKYVANDIKFDYIIECQNRLWACYYGKKDGKLINEIFCTAWGTFNEWNYYESPGAASFTASIGTPGPFTGATVVNQNPVFFKEDYVHKVYVSSAGDHQVVTLNCLGLQEGSSKSLAHVNGYIIYKTRNDFVVFDGSNTTPISLNLGDTNFKNVIAGASGNKYVMYCENSGSGKNCFTYDTTLGIWHKEDVPSGQMKAMVLRAGKLCMVVNNTSSFSVYEHDSSNNMQSVNFMFETGEIGFNTPDKKYISRIDLCVSLSAGTHMQVFMQYDSEEMWIPAGSFLGTKAIPKLTSLPILPRRCNHFKLRLNGNGAFNLYSITKVLEQGE